MRFFQLNLKKLIILVALSSFLLSIISNAISTYRINSQILINQELKANEAYVQKIAHTTDTHISQLVKRLSYSAKVLTKDPDNLALYQQEAERLLYQEDAFNAIVISDETTTVVAAEPNRDKLLGEKLFTEQAKEANALQKTYVSVPYVSQLGNLSIFISVPIFTESGVYKGVIGGVIYLKVDNLFQTILGKHYYKDGSYVYVVDRNGRVVFHPDQSRINELVTQNEVVQKVIKGSSGAQLVTNTQNTEMIAGYAYIPAAQLGIVSQRPKEITLEPTKDMIRQIELETIPYLIIALLLIFFGATKISKPLQQLATFVTRSGAKNEQANIEQIKGWYYEAIELKKATLVSFSSLHEKVNLLTDQSYVDALTGLYNRRAFDEQMQKWLEKKIPFCLAMIDIDHFKRVNDTHGHLVGDEVLKFLSEIIKSETRVVDICCRYGGEEFVILLPETTKDVAIHVVERLREKVSQTVAPHGDKITISAGLVSTTETFSEPTNFIHVADLRLYEAKKNGRNQIVS